MTKRKENIITALVYLLIFSVTLIFGYYDNNRKKRIMKKFYEENELVTKCYIIKDKHEEIKSSFKGYVTTDHYFIFNNGYTRLVPLQEYISYVIGDTICYDEYMQRNIRNPP